MPPSQRRDESQQRGRDNAHPETDEEVTTLTASYNSERCFKCGHITIKRLNTFIKSKCSVSFADYMATKTQFVGTSKMANVPQVIWMPIRDIPFSK